ncbi:hypothetical protein HOLleu_03263 [Holothuria leucospilota]|uniref:Uncharacterized protein n=1 Tax=Holothuria leucospilota TaxID=206669 RepID=A0A9Q1CRD6_HOLLE|nr:hypothetical protein HOLleu_03263 [Holothuria leucospilota]
MDDNQTYPQIPDELYNAGWRVHYSLENNKPYFVNEKTKMRADTLPTLVNNPSTSNVTLFENAVIDLTGELPLPDFTEDIPSFYTERKQCAETLSSSMGVLKTCEPRLSKKEAEGLGKPCQQRMDEAMTRFPLGAHLKNMEPSETVQALISYIFASMMDRVAYGYLKQNCEGCDMDWPSQLDHRCMNFGSNIPVTDIYFNDLHYLVKDEWVIDATRNYLLNGVEISTVRAVMRQLRTLWSQQPDLSVDAIEKSNINETIRGQLEDEFIPRWMGGNRLFICSIELYIVT